MYSTKAQTQLGLRFSPFPGPSSSGNQDIGEHTLPGRQCILSPPRSQPFGFRVRSRSAVSGVPYVSSQELISDCNCPGGYQPPRIPRRLSNWEPALGLVEDAISGNEIALCLPALAAAHLPLCLWWRDGPICRWLALLWYSLNPLFCEWARLCVRLLG